MQLAKSDYPDDWDTRRSNVYQRDKYTCCNCRRRGGPYGDLELHAHHIVPKSRGGTHDYSNLITACEPCHSAIHNDVLAPTAGATTDSLTSPMADLRKAARDAKRAYRMGKKIVGVFR